MFLSHQPRTSRNHGCWTQQQGPHGQYKAFRQCLMPTSASEALSREGSSREGAQVVVDSRVIQGDLRAHDRVHLARENHQQLALLVFRSWVSISAPPTPQWRPWKEAGRPSLQMLKEHARPRPLSPTPRQEIALLDRCGSFSF